MFKEQKYWEVVAGPIVMFTLSDLPTTDSEWHWMETVSCKMLIRAKQYIFVLFWGFMAKTDYIPGAVIEQQRK